jgi:hypothetical protein
LDLFTKPDHTADCETNGIGCVERSSEVDRWLIAQYNARLEQERAIAGVIDTVISLAGMKTGRGSGGAPTAQGRSRKVGAPRPASTTSASPSLKKGDVLTYEEYQQRRTPGSTLRGHHTPQQARLKEKGIDPRKGTVVVVESDSHDATRNFKSAGAKTAREEKGLSLSESEAKDLLDPPVLQLGPDVASKIRERNRTNFPAYYPPPAPPKPD